MGANRSLLLHGHFLLRGCVRGRRQAGFLLGGIRQGQRRVRGSGLTGWFNSRERRIRYALLLLGLEEPLAAEMLGACDVIVDLIPQSDDKRSNKPEIKPIEQPGINPITDLHSQPQQCETHPEASKEDLLR